MNISEFVHDPGFPVYRDARLIDEYLNSGRAMPPLMTSIGDPSFTSAQVPQRLLDYAREVPRELHGYQASMGGLPAARQAIADYLIRTTGLDHVGQYGDDFQIALTAGGTRGVIGDFGRLLRARAATSGGDRAVPVALCANPCWDYAGPLAEAGFEMVYWPLRADNNWLPDIADAQNVAGKVAAQSSRRLAMVIVNAQHNPTGRGWSLETLIGLFELAAAHNAAVLLDDPYFEVRTPNAVPVSAPAALLEFLADSRNSKRKLDWCAVRSLGKQVGVNGWGVGTLIANPDTLKVLLDFAFRRRFPGNAHHEWAVAQYLADPISEQDAIAQREALADKRSRFACTLQELGWPKEMISPGEFTPYVLVAIPTAWARLPDGAEQYRRYLLDRTGILIAHASIEDSSLGGVDSETRWVRFYLGVADEVFATILDRLATAAITYHSMPSGQPGSIDVP
ncbi:pyridoxal phosphate-dependent aminotransferase [Saccharothrix sp. Mg75]|uniref:pyridoxal phosphate-dependent aminotransferase n=1 Tax=Saccharothrix sp. Mg75 TaxID=3445357 RepID=UPI003EEE3661